MYDKELKLVFYLLLGDKIEDFMKLENWLWVYRGGVLFCEVWE